MSPTKISHKFRLKMQRLTYRKRLLRAGLLVSNIVVLGIVLLFVIQNSPTDTTTALTPNDQPAVANPLDQLSSANIALTVARLISLPEATAISNQADSQAAELQMSAATNSVITKPQVVATALKSRANIFTYVTQPGDTVPTLAAR